MPMILVGNKVDRANEREVSKEEAQTLARRLGCDLSTLRFLLARSRADFVVLVETSAKTRVNLETAY